MTMRALTLWRPWPYAIFHLGKNIENRPWAPWPAVIGERIAIHAGHKKDKDGASFIQEISGVLPPIGQPGVIVGTVWIDGYFELNKDNVMLFFNPWAFGPYCWKLKDPIEFKEPIPCKGALGLWYVPDEIEKTINELERKYENLRRIKLAK